jgi:hypothetical protein
MAPDIHERRRYTSVLVCHDDLRDFEAFRQLMESSVNTALGVRLIDSPWIVHRFEFLTGRSHYPSHIVSPDHRRRGSLFAHDVYFATRSPLESLGSPVILLASPYVKLLASITSRLRQALRRCIDSCPTARQESSRPQK